MTPSGVWFGGRRFARSIGRGGIRVDKREGDGATPAGCHRVAGMLYRRDRMAPPVHWATPVGPRDLWCDDPVNGRYNARVRAPFGGSAEALRRGDRLYDLVILTDWNMEPAIPGRGSAIFLHRWRRPGYPTEGCVAFDAADLLWIARRIVRQTRVIVPG